MKQLRGFEVKMMPATNTRGYRVKILCLQYGNCFYIPYDYEIDTTAQMAAKFLNSKGVKIKSYATFGSKTILLTDNFERITK